jgi:FHA domain
MSENPDPFAPFPAASLEPPGEDQTDLLAMQTILTGQPPLASGSGAGSGTATRLFTANADDTLPFRPRQRPPMALLFIVHDGNCGGEWVSLRGDRYVIGRTEGEIRIPHDGQVSSRHAEISRARTAHEDRWQLCDLGSTNGTYVRVSKLTLQHGQELIFGQTHYRFEDPPPQPATANALATVRAGAAPLPGNPGGTSASGLVHISPVGDGPRICLVRNEYWLGRDVNACAIVPDNDPFVSPQHARLFQGNDGRWRIENNRSRNGIWLRLSRPMPVESVCQFQAGEQRFILKILT